jgi:short-subunit dehydrogenase
MPTPTEGAWAGRVAVVTGASSGIGRVTARAFARRGATVVAVARREALLETLADQCRQDVPDSFHLAGDLGDRTFAEHVVAATIARTGRIDVLVNNAAVPKHKHALHLDPDEIETVMRVNFLSAIWTTYAALPHFLRTGRGAIVNVSSFAAKVTPAREAAYAASKAAMNAFSEGLWHDLAGTNIHVAIVNPGPIDTEIWEKADEPIAYRGHKYSPEMVADVILAAAAGRVWERTVPRFDPMLLTARLLRLASPALTRLGMARMDPVPGALIEEARRRAREESSSS